MLFRSEKLNQIPKGELVGDLKELASQESSSNNRQPEKVEVSQSYVSSSPGFVPNNHTNRRNNYNRNKKRNKK